MGPYLGTPNTEKESENGDSVQTKWGATSMQGWRKSQEDAHIARTDLPDNVSVFGVFDGHGGKEVSLWVKEHFIEELLKLEEFKSKNYGEALKVCFRRMDVMMLEPEGMAQLRQITTESGNPDPFAGGMAGGENAAQHCGCTATVILMTMTHIYCANAGDSRVVLGRSAGDEMCFPLSDDHKPENTIEKNRIEAAGGFVEENRVNGSLALSRALGDFEYKGRADMDYKLQAVTCDAELRQVTRSANDQFIILACDGIWDCLTSEECVAQTRTALAAQTDDAPISKIVEDMFDQIIAKDILSSAGVGTDNMTAIIVQLKARAI